MSNHRLYKQLIVAGLAVLVFTSVAEALVICGSFPIFGVVNGLQTARLNAVLNPPPDTDLPCPATLGFIDSQGRAIGNPDIFQLRGGAAVGVNFIGDPNIRVGERLQIRAVVTYSDPNEFPGC